MRDNNRPARPGISAVLMAAETNVAAVLDLAAVLQGLVSDRFEILLVSPSPALTPAQLADLAARLPLRQVHGRGRNAGGRAARFELVFVSAADGRFDVRELNHLLEAIERGAEAAGGYRPRPIDVFVRCLRRFGIRRLSLDYAYALSPRGAVHNSVGRTMARLCRSGRRIAEIPVRDRTPTLSALVSAGSYAAEELSPTP